MFTVTYTYYSKYQHVKKFASERSAKKFFWYVQKRSGVTHTEFRAA